MIKIWRNRVWAGTQVLANCPSKYKTGVINLMRQDIQDNTHSIQDLNRLLEDEIITQEEYNQING